ncbi:MAG: hypothetical protein HFH62_00145 [Lachnospiraceae bacterium]|nr:hypothetical protein [Lachnospiraceae bacterium]
MDKKIMDVLTNPVKCKLFLEIQKCGETTAKHLSEAFSNIPSATLYRYLKRMTNDKVLKIVNQTQIRGAVENTYAVDINLTKHFKEVLDSNSGEAYMQAFMQYIIGFAELFQDYCKRDDIDIAKDKSGFSLSPLSLTDEELEMLIENIRDVVKPYESNTPAEGRKLHSIGVIISPPKMD